MSLTDEQREMRPGKRDDLIRKDKFTASTGPGYLGYVPYPDGSPLALWEVNAGIREFNGNEATEMGELLEDPIARRVQKLEGLGPMVEIGTLVSPSWLCATPDRLFPEDKIGLQIKNHEPHMARAYLGKPGSAGEWDNDLIPIYIHMQCQIELAVVAAIYGRDWKIWLLAAYFGGSDLRIYRLRRHQPFLDSLIPAAHTFWKQHLDPNGPRIPPDNSTWQAGKREPRRAPKLKDEELMNAPVPFMEERKA